MDAGIPLKVVDPVDRAAVQRNNEEFGWKELSRAGLRQII